MLRRSEQENHRNKEMMGEIGDQRKRPKMKPQEEGRDEYIGNRRRHNITGEIRIENRYREESARGYRLGRETKVERRHR